MREVKFRGKRVDNGELVYGDLYQPNTDKPLFQYYGLIFIHSHSDSSKLQVIPETAGQFTGKKDDGEDDLYDGDIIQFDWGFKSCIGVIYWCEKELAFMVENKTIDGYVVYLAEVDNAVTKLGNIHDNPELLEVSNA